MLHAADTTRSSDKYVDIFKIHIEYQRSKYIKLV